MRNVFLAIALLTISFGCAHGGGISKKPVIVATGPATTVSPASMPESAAVTPEAVVGPWLTHEEIDGFVKTMLETAYSLETALPHDSVSYSRHRPVCGTSEFGPLWEKISVESSKLSEGLERFWDEWSNHCPGYGGIVLYSLGGAIWALLTRFLESERLVLAACGCESEGRTLDGGVKEAICVSPEAEIACYDALESALEALRAYVYLHGHGLHTVCVP